MEENPYKAPVETMRAKRPNDRKWSRGRGRWSPGQPLALFYLVVTATGVLAAMLAPLIRR